MDRRQFLLGAAGAGVSLALPVTSLAVPQTSVRALDLYRPQANERLTLNYLVDGQWAPEAYKKLCWLLRDVQANEFVQIDLELIAILDWIQGYLKQYGYTTPIHVLSGFRTKKTNDKTEGAAKASFHLYGRAVDIRIPGLPVRYLGDLCAWLKQGGVGVYADKGFVHLDTGPVRRFTPPK